MRITEKYLALCLTSALSIAGLSSISNAAEIISASSHLGNAAKVTVYRPPVSATGADEAAPEPSKQETRIVLNVPVYVSTRRARRNSWRAYRASNRIIGPNYPGFNKDYFGPLYPF